MNILSDSSGDPRSEEWWAKLTLSEWIEHMLSDVLCALGQVNARLQTEEGRPLRWMDPSIECAFGDIDRILAKLEGKDRDNPRGG